MSGRRVEGRASWKVAGLDLDLDASGFRRIRERRGNISDRAEQEHCLCCRRKTIAVLAQDCYLEKIVKLETGWS